MTTDATFRERLLRHARDRGDRDALVGRGAALPRNPQGKALGPELAGRLEEDRA